MKKIRLAYIRTQFWLNLKVGGSVSHTLGVLNSLKKSNCIFKIISNEKFLGIGGFNYKIIKPILFTKKLVEIGELLFNFYSKNKFKNEILKFKPDIIYHRFSSKTFFITMLAKKLKIPLILEYSGSGIWALKYWFGKENKILNFFNKYLRIKYLQIIEDYNVKNASLVVAVSNPLKEDLIKAGVPDNKILVNPNGVDIDKFNPEVVEDKRCKIILRKLELNNRKKIIGFVGTFGPWHGIYQLVSAIDKINSMRQYSDLTFLLIGDGSLRKFAEDKLKKYDNVIFTGSIDYSDIQYYLAICNILVSPHCYQADGKEFFGSPTKLFEYMAMGKGIVASNLGQIGRVLEHNKTAVLVEPENVEELSTGILKLVKNEKLRKKLGSNARDVVIKKYTWDKNTKRLMDAIVKKKIIK